MANIFQQAKQAMDLRNKMKKVQKDLENQITDYDNAGVKISVRGDLTLASISISPEVVDPTKVDRLERTIQENINKAFKLAKDKAAQYTQEMMKDMGALGNMFG